MSDSKRSNKYIELQYNKSHSKIIYEQFYENFQEISSKVIRDMYHKIIQFYNNINTFFLEDNTIQKREIAQKLSKLNSSTSYPQKSKGKVRSILGLFFKDEAYVLKINHI